MTSFSSFVPPVSVNPTRELAPGVWWLSSCRVVERGERITHFHLSTFLILGSEETLLFDTTFGHGDAFQALEHDLDQLLAGRTLDWVVPSHPEAGHVGGLRRLLRKYPEARVPGSLRDYHFYFPEFEDRFAPLEFGSHVPLGGGESFVVLPGLIRDLPTTQWGYSTAGKVLFVSDGLGFGHHPVDEVEVEDDDDPPSHLPGECTLMASELPAPPTLEQIAYTNRSGLFFLNYMRPEHLLTKVIDPFEQLLRDYPTNIIAPAHGAVIDDLEFVHLLFEGYRKAFHTEL